MKNIKDILQEYNQLGIGEQIDYAKFYLYSIITHSTAIEGSTVTEIENRLLFDEGIGAQKPLIEQMMNIDLKAAYEQSIVYAREHNDYTVELLRGLSALVMKNTGSEYNSKQYISSLEQSEEAEDSKNFKTFMLQHHCDNLLKQIEEYKHSMGDEFHSAKSDSTLDGTMALRIIGALHAKPSATMDNLSNTLGIARRKLVRYMNKLQEDNKIKRMGGRLYGHWEIIKEDNE